MEACGGRSGGQQRVRAVFKKCRRFGRVDSASQQKHTKRPQTERDVAED